MDDRIQQLQQYIRENLCQPLHSMLLPGTLPGSKGHFLDGHPGMWEKIVASVLPKNRKNEGLEKFNFSNP